MCSSPDDLQFRSIVGGPNAPTHRLSNLLDILLKPLCVKVKSNIRDDFDFLKQLSNAKLVTFDIINFYTNITLYQQQIIENGIQKALQIERTELLNQPRHENAEKNILPLATTHNPRNKKNITPKVNQLQEVLKQNLTTKNLQKKILIS
ncbi:hypothetical protein KUTeg_020091 [Tegillarca granosa]|uniref:Uncharacterized protein n=1 Tax=Tegillarca granosa TaxID=220873 RepID=A0ABQ9E6Y0_TEGGR|nr:hypothetical protein KUTeg_020091 [Tegillarca granosa]